MSRLIIYPIIILFIGMLCFALMPTVISCGGYGHRSSCKSNLREFIKMFRIYEDIYGRGVPMETVEGIGTSQLKALLWGTYTGPTATDRSPDSAILKSPKLFICPSDSDVEVGSGDLNMLRVTATIPEFHRYTSYVLAARNLKEPEGDQVVMADDAEDGSNGNWFNGTGGINTMAVAANGTASPTFNFYQAGNPAFYTHKEGALAIMGDNSAIFLPGTDGVSREMWKGNPKSDATVSCYY